MQVNKWGPSGWTFLHTITFNYPEKPSDDDKLYYSQFFNLLSVTLPCKYCQASFKIYAKYIPITDFLDDREGIRKTYKRALEFCKEEKDYFSENWIMWEKM